MRVIWIALLGVAVLAGSAAGASKGGSVDLVAYSTPKDAYGKIISSFQKTQAGSGVDFSQSYGASGDQARAVAAGQDADLVALSLDPDVSLLVGKGLVPEELERQLAPGDRLRLGRGLRRPRRQPEEDQGLGRPGQARASR